MLIHKYIELKRLVEELHRDIEILTYRDNYLAGTRARKNLQEIRQHCLQLRKLIQIRRTAFLHRDDKRQ